MRSDVSVISLSDIAGAFSGRITRWTDINGEDLPLTVHLGPEADGQVQRFIDEVVRASGGKMSAEVIRHASDEELAAAVDADAGALGILPQTVVENVQPIALRDHCGFITSPRVTTLKTEDYPLTAPMFLYLPKTPFAAACP